METAFFLPTSRGSLAAVAEIPTRPGADVTAVLLAGGRAGKMLLKLIATDLAEAGVTCLRFDYPGSGATPGAGSYAEADLVELTREAASWWRELTGAGDLCLIGHCLGARLALATAACEDSVSSVAAIHLPMGDRSLSRRIRSKVRTLDARGPKLATRFVPGPRVLDRGSGAAESDVGSVAHDLRDAAAETELRFLYGQNDKALTSFRELVDGLPEEVGARLDVSVKPDSRLHGLPDRDNFTWIRAQIREVLIPRDT